MNYSDKFNYPEPTDFPVSEYEANKEEIDRIALEQGYKLVGYRHNLAIFSSKNGKL